MEVEHGDRPPGVASRIDPGIAREGLTMGLYLTISLLAVLTAKSGDADDGAVLTLIWGSTLGLALAHWLAFQLAARLFVGSTLTSHDRLAMLAQAAAAVVVAALASLPLLLGVSAATALSRGVLAGLIGLFAFGAVRSHSGSIARASGYAVAVVVLATLVATSKYLLAGY
ncbi:MAG: hypothetical protein ACLFS9_11135 [Nitriliruptoraceae bacterium]